MPKKKETVEGEVLKEKRVTKKKADADHPKEEKTKTSRVKVEEKKEYRKAYFFPRLMAYIIDFAIVTLLLSFILMFFPANENYSAYLEEYEQIQMNYLEGKTSADEYINQSVDVVHDLDYSNVMTSVVGVIVFILYFVVFQFYNNGQTLGKKLMGVRVVSTTGDDKVSMNQYVLRSLLVNSLVCNILLIGMVLFMSRDVYFYAKFIVEGIQSILILASAFMVIYSASGRGLHDKMAATRVVMVD